MIETYEERRTQSVSSLKFRVSGLRTKGEGAKGEGRTSTFEVRSSKFELRRGGEFGGYNNRAEQKSRPNNLLPIS